MIREGQYLMWFTRYGSTEVQTMPSLEDCYDLACQLDDCETWFFDQYGCLGEVERVGHGVIPDDEWTQGLEVYIAQQRAEAAQRQAETPRTPAVGVVEVRRPDGRGFGGGVGMATMDELDAERVRLDALFGADRVHVRIYRKVVEG